VQLARLRLDNRNTDQQVNSVMNKFSVTNNFLGRAVVACALVLAFAGNAFAGITADHKNTAMSLLLSENHLDFRTAGMMVKDEKLTDPAILDLVAERLLQGASRQSDPEQNKTMLYLLRIFAATPEPRYRLALEQCLTSYDDKDMKKEIQDILAAMPTSAPTTYQPGSLSVDSLRSELAQVSERNHQELAGRSRELPPLGQSMDEVYAKLGLPDEVRSLDITYTRLGNIKAFYYGLGMVQFDYPIDGAPVLRVVVVMPEVPGAVARYKGPNTQYAHALACADEKYYRYLVKGGWELVAADPGLVDVLYDKMKALAPTKNKYALNGMVYTLKRLAPMKPAGWDEFLNQLEPLLADRGVAALARKL
jgi:hypothetical protein